MAMKIRLQDVSIDHMIQDRAFEPQRTANSYLDIDLSDVVSDIHGRELRPITDTNLTDYSVNTMLRLALESHGMPNQSSELITIRKGNEAIKFAGGVTYDDIDVVVTDFIGADVENLISAWDAKRYNPVTGMMFPAVNYKRRGTIVQYSPDGEITRTWTLLGCWLNSVKYGDYNRSEAASERKISFTIHIDKAYPDVRVAGTNY